MRFMVGDVLTLNGGAVDPETGAMPASALSWRVILHHVPASNIASRHTHPFFSGVGNDLTLPPMPEPEDLDTTRLGYLEIQLTASEPGGPATTVTQTLAPVRAALIFTSQPLPFLAKVNERASLLPIEVVAWQNQQLAITLDETQTAIGESTMRFERWGDGSARERVIRAPGVSTIYTATFKPGGSTTSTRVFRLLLPLAGR
jgi:hypothetical protein